MELVGVGVGKEKLIHLFKVYEYIIFNAETV
jgi:hypothetical protein